jgi:hypothetical protein
MAKRLSSFTPVNIRLAIPSLAKIAPACQGSSPQLPIATFHDTLARVCMRGIVINNASQRKLLPEISVQRKTYVRGSNNKKKIKKTDFPAEAPENNSHQYEASNAEHSLHDLSSECLKEFSLTRFKESRDHAKNYGGAKQAEKHGPHEVFPKYCHSLLVRCRDSKP